MKSPDSAPWIVVSIPGGSGRTTDITEANLPFFIFAEERRTMLARPYDHMR